MIQNDKKRNKPKIAVLFVLFKNANKNLLNNFSSYVDILIKTSAIGFLIAQKKKNLPPPAPVNGIGNEGGGEINYYIKYQLKGPALPMSKIILVFN